MKQIFFLCVLFFVSAVQVAWGQIPPTLSYQGVLTDKEGAYSLTFNLYNAVTGGSLSGARPRRLSSSKGSSTWF